MTAPLKELLASKTTLHSIEVNGDAISAFVTNNYIRLHPECIASIPEHSLRRICKEDLSYHLDYIKSALASGSEQVFFDYLAWLRSVLETRGLSLDHPRDSLSLMCDYLVRIVEPRDVLTVKRLLERGIHLFDKKRPTSLTPPAPLDFQRKETAVFTRMLLDGQRRDASRILREVMQGGVSYVDASVGIVQPAMYEVGRLWQLNRISIAQEHLASASAQNVLAQNFNEAVFAEPNGRTAVFACVAGNHHTLGLRMVSDAFEVAGWDIDYLGADTPSKDLIRLLDEKRPDMLGLSVSLPNHILALRQLIEQIRAELGSGCPAITVGGLTLNLLKGMRGKLGEDIWYPDARRAIADAQ